MSEEEFDNRMADEMTAIANMIKRAQSEGLLVEVVNQFGDYRALGDTVSEACRCACYEWDV